jgi:hypothetical protein
MAKKKDINDVTDEISLIMREVVEATESNLLFEIANTLEKHSEGAKSSEDYLRKQMSENKALQQRMQRIAREGEQLQINVAKNIGTFAGINTAPLEQEIKKGTKIVLDSGMDDKNKQVQKIYRLNKFNTSAQFIPDLRQSIIKATEEGIEKGIDITYKRGRKIGYREYMEMAVRTGIQQEIGEQQIEIAKEANIVFFVCDEFGDCADDHADYQGKIYYNADYTNFNLTDQAKVMISRAITRKKLLSVQEVRDNKPFLTTRPNCRHRLIPISIDEAIGEDLSKVKQSVDSVRGNYRPENYEASQQQRAYERTIRNNKKVLDFFEKKKGDNKSNEYDKVIQAKRNNISRNQFKLRQLLQSNPSLSREPRRETRKILIKDLGVKYNLKNMKGQPPTPVTNNPPPTPPIVKIETQKKMDETVASHYAMPEEKKVYIKQKYDIDWGSVTFRNTLRISAPSKSLAADVGVWRTSIDEVGIPTEQDTEERRKVLFLYKDVWKHTDLYDIGYQTQKAYYSPQANLVVVQRLNKRDVASKNRNVNTFTHELGHALEYSLATRFGFTNKHGIGITKIGTDDIIGKLAREYKAGGAYRGTSKTFYNQKADPMDKNSKTVKEVLVEDIIEKMKQDPEIVPEQIEMFKGSLAFNQGLDDAEIKPSASNYKGGMGFILSDDVENFYEKVKSNPSYVAMDNYINKNRSLVKDVTKELGWDEDNKRYEDTVERLKNGVRNGDPQAIAEYEIERKKILAKQKIYLATVEKRREQLEKENIGISQVGDFYDALSKGRFYSTRRPNKELYTMSGHGTAYYATRENQNVEIFTHLMTLQTLNPKLYEKVKKDYPSIVGSFEKMVSIGVDSLTNQQAKLKEHQGAGRTGRKYQHIGKSFEDELDSPF